MSYDWTEKTEIKSVGDVFQKNSDGSEEPLFDILCGNSIGFFLSKKYGVTPKVGDSVQLKSRGMSVGGVKLNDVIVYELTLEQLDEKEERQRQEVMVDQKKKFEQNIAQHDAEYEALPPIFKKRIDRLRKNYVNFRWQCEAYDVYACKEGIKMAAHIKTLDELKEFCDLPYEQQKKIVPLDPDHSGGTFSQATQIAHCLIQKQYHYIPYIHSSLAAIGGCEAVGCFPPTEEELKEIKLYETGEKKLTYENP